MRVSTRLSVAASSFAAPEGQSVGRPRRIYHPAHRRRAASELEIRYPENGGASMAGTGSADGAGVSSKKYAPMKGVDEIVDERNERAGYRERIVDG